MLPGRGLVELNRRHGDVITRFSLVDLSQWAGGLSKMEDSSQTEMLHSRQVTAEMSLVFDVIDVR